MRREAENRIFLNILDEMNINGKFQWLSAQRLGGILKIV